MKRLISHSRRADALAVLAVLAIAAAVSAGHWGGRIVWNADSLFYQAHVLELRGSSEHQAVSQVFSTDYAKTCCQKWLPDSAYRGDRWNPDWIAFATPVYGRRWLTPALGASVYGFLGIHSLKDVSLLAYLLLGPVLYLFLRRRFSRGVSVLVAGGALLLPPLRFWAFQPMTDTWALLLETALLGVALLALERGMRWLPLWIAGILALSLTRDATLALVIATAWIALRRRDRRALVLAVTGAVASAPVPLIFGASLRGHLAWMLSGFEAHPDTSWHYIVAHYPSAIARYVHADARWPLTQGAPLLVMLVGVVLIAGLVLLFVSRREEDVYLTLARAGTVGALISLLPTLNSTNMRLELLFVPFVAVGVALLAERSSQWMRRRRVPRLAPFWPQRQRDYA